MSNGSLDDGSSFLDGGDSDAPADADSAVETAKDEFPDSAPSPVEPCAPPGSGSGSATPPPQPCSAATIKSKLDACDGGTHVWNDAKTALGKDPTVQVGPVDGGFQANTNVQTGVITIAPTTDCCDATQSLFFELTNAKSKQRHLDIANDAAAGNVAREDFAKREARVEYDGVILLKNTFPTCRAAWGCSASATTGYENVSPDFDTYYASQTDRYKDYYRNFWDNNYKAAYQAKHH